MSILDRLRSLFGYESEQDGPYYVYELLDARFDRPVVFYIGSGYGDRMYQHEKDARAILSRITKTPGAAMKLSCKHKRMIEIWDAGYEVQYAIAFRSRSRCRAYQVEAQYIRDFGLERLSNETFGWSDAAVRKCFAAEQAVLQSAY
jgi:hypothetical protein